MKRLFAATILLLIFSLQLLPASETGNGLYQQQQTEELPQGNEAPQTGTEKNIFTEFQEAALCWFTYRRAAAGRKLYNTATYPLPVSEVAVPPPKWQG